MGVAALFQNGMLPSLQASGLKSSLIAKQFILAMTLQLLSEAMFAWDNIGSHSIR